ncbi:MAG: radical SAM family heme chaperone HemW [Acidobacteria bacterium]|nr:radical SAM family heme chaperone HemW [Acidobacteriota bacterium]
MTAAGIYISIPFCRQKCTYCNFASGVHASSLLPRYVECLTNEIIARNELWDQAGVTAAEFHVDSIYLGGGTPGMLDSWQPGDILGAIRQSFAVMADCEITIEASPENVTSAAAAAWAASGINRVSLGVQSMVTEELRAVGRLHDERTVAEAFAALREAGTCNISADLIAGLPKQTTMSWERSLRALLELQPQHFSVYMLEVDDDSRLGREMLQHGERYHVGAVPREDAVAEFYCAAVDLLRASGFDHYEISNFARPGRRSRHNQKYWTNAPYFGFGADAHSYDGQRRWCNTDSVVAYVETIEKNVPAIHEQHSLGRREKLEERIFLGLRCRDGISLSSLDEEFASELDPSAHSVREHYKQPITQFCEAGWLESEADRLRLTDRGVLFSNEVFAGFLLEQPG